MLIENKKGDNRYIIMTESNTIPRMRTIPKAYEEIKRLDNNTCFSLRTLRRMVSTGEIPTVQINSKRLINLDLLLDRLACYNDCTIRTSEQGVH